MTGGNGCSVQCPELDQMQGGLTASVSFLILPLSKSEMVQFCYFVLFFANQGQWKRI